MGRERGQSTVEWVGMLCVLALAIAALLAAGIAAPTGSLARALASRILCAASLASSCEREPTLIAAYGTEVGRLLHRHAPTLAFESGSRALPVDFRRCRRTACADGAPDGALTRSDSGVPVTAFVRVIDCRGEPDPEVRCDGERRGNLYLQYWLYYADSSTMRGVPVAEGFGYHADDWESVQFRLRPDGTVDQRASSHHGYNHSRGAANWGADAGIGPLRDLAETLGARPENGWGPATGLLLVSGGSHAGAVAGEPRGSRFTPGGRLRLVPLEPVAEASRARFAVSAPWAKRVWHDPEYGGTD